MKRLLLILGSLLSTAAFSQKVFFTSPVTFKESHLEEPYASVNIQGDLVVFNAPDFKLYAYDKNTGASRWDHYISWKSTRPPYFVGNGIWTKMYGKWVQLDTATGEKRKEIPFETVGMQPVEKNGILYFTAIHDGGSIIAYDPKSDSILWRHFIAHGYERKPYFLADRMVVNYEGDQWFDVNYAGVFMDSSCKKGNDEYEQEGPCLQHFDAMTHDGKVIKDKIAEKLGLGSYSEPKMVTTSKHTFLITEGKLTVLGNKLKKKVAVELSSLIPSSEEVYEDDYSSILHADDTNVWMIYNQHLFIYNHAKKKLEKLVDLSTWEPQQVVADNNNLWLISRKDGRLYGVSI